MRRVGSGSNSLLASCWAKSAVVLIALGHSNSRVERSLIEKKAASGIRFWRRATVLTSIKKIVILMSK